MKTVFAGPNSSSRDSHVSKPFGKSQTLSFIPKKSGSQQCSICQVQAVIEQGKQRRIARQLISLWDAEMFIQNDNATKLHTSECAFTRLEALISTVQNQK